MQQRISLREANQHLSRYVESVERGDEVVITRRGVPVARLVPYQPTRGLTAQQAEARARTRERLERGYHLGGERPSRDDLHER